MERHLKFFIIYWSIKNKWKFEGEHLKNKKIELDRIWNLRV